MYKILQLAESLDPCQPVDTVQVNMGQCVLQAL